MRAELSDSFAGTTSYFYDPVNRLTVLTTPQGDAFETSYDLAGRTLGRVAPNVTDMLRQYDVATGRLARQTQRNAGTAFNAFDYDYIATAVAFYGYNWFPEPIIGLRPSVKAHHLQSAVIYPRLRRAGKSCAVRLTAMTRLSV